MQERQHNRELYFKELALTSRTYYLPYIARFKRMERGMNVLEVGCGEGGNLLPFAETGCNVTGVDLSTSTRHVHCFGHLPAERTGAFVRPDSVPRRHRTYRTESSFPVRPEALSQARRHCLHVFSGLADALRWTSADMQEQSNIPPALHPPAAFPTLQGHPESGRRNPSTHRGTAFYQTNTDIDRAVRETGEAGVYPRRQAALLHKSPLRSEIRAEAPQAAGTHCQHSLREEFLHNFLLLSVEMTGTTFCLKRTLVSRHSGPDSATRTRIGH